MGRRGREPLETCAKCGRQTPRGKMVMLWTSSVLSTDLKTADDVKSFTRRKGYYCPKCAKHYHIYDKVKRMKERQFSRKFGPKSPTDIY